MDTVQSLTKLSKLLISKFYATLQSTDFVIVTEILSKIRRCRGHNYKGMLTKIIYRFNSMSILITFILITYSELESCYKVDNYVNKPRNDNLIGNWHDLKTHTVLNGYIYSHKIPVCMQMQKVFKYTYR